MGVYGEPEPPYPEAYCKGIWLFNHGYFFECHEVLEELWLESIGTPKLFYQMLIHAAVCFVHWEGENRKGVLSLYRTFEGRAAKLPASRYMGLEVGGLREQLSTLVQPLQEDPSLPLPPFSGIRLPQVEVQGFEPLPVSDEELQRLGRHSGEEG